MKFDFRYLLSAKQAQWIGMALAAFFALLILLEWSYLNFSPVPVSTQTESGQKGSSMAKSDTFESILKASLFGIYVSNDLNDGSVKQSMLNVTLVGILFADKMEDSQVIIRAAGGEDRTYKVGDSIPGDALIKRITASGILVEHHGALESLSLPKNELTFEPVAKPLKGE